ncbi:MAG: glycosyltransferase family 4 protein [Phormidesmis sp.]
MKILIVHDYAELIGGAEIGAITLRDGLRDRGHSAQLFAARTQPDVTCAADATCLGTTSRWRGLLQTANPWAYQSLRRTLADFQPDVVHVRMFLTQLSPLILPLLRTVPSIYHVVWYRPICPTGNKLLPTGEACTYAAGSACYGNNCLPLHDWIPLMGQLKLWRQWRTAFSRIVANSFAVKHQLTQAGIDPVDVIWNGVPQPPPPPDLIALNDAPTIAVAGRLTHEKGVDVLLRAVALIVDRVPNVQVVIAGDGPERLALQALATELGIDTQVTLLGHIPRAEVEQAFAGAWVQVVPSRWAEPFGFVAPEAMMRGMPVIASNSGGLAEVVLDGETGFSVPAGEAAPMAEVLLKLLSDPDLVRRLGRAGRQRAVTHFSESVWVEQFIDLYQSLTLSKSPHPPFPE